MPTLSLSLSVVVDCGPLPNPPNGTITQSSTVFTSEVTYRCNANFRLVGSSMRECNESGVWSSSEPICEGTCIPDLCCVLPGRPVYNSIQNIELSCHLCFRGIDITIRIEWVGGRLGANWVQLCVLGLWVIVAGGH